jgi:hypothetical protein
MIFISESVTIVSEVMKILLVKITLLSLFLFSHSAPAMSCRVYIQFVIRCQQDVCKEGFFAHRRLAGGLCSSILDVPGEEPIRKFDGDLSRLRKMDSFLFDGYYLISIPDHGYRYDRKVEDLRCFKQNPQGEFSYSCEDEKIQFERLDYLSDQELPTVIAEMALRSKKEAAYDQGMDFFLPVLMLAMTIWATLHFDRASGNRLAVGVFAISLLGVPHVFWGRSSWILSTLVGWAFCLIWICVKLIVRSRKNKEQ